MSPVIVVHAAPSRPAIPPGDRRRHCADEGFTRQRAERRAAPSRPAIPSGDRRRYSADEGHHPS